MITINDLSVGDRATIRHLHADNRAYRHKLLSLGLLPGTEIVLSRIAPLGCPVQIDCRGAQVSLRRAEAEGIVLEMLES